MNEAMAAGLPVLVSNRCGCVPDLVREGENGFTFDPTDGKALASMMARLTQLSPVSRAALGRRSRELIAAFSPAAFAEGMEAAVAAALKRRRKRGLWLTRLFARSLALRPTAGA